MKEVRIGVIGTGGMGSFHLNYLKNVAGAKLAAVCDIKKDLADKHAGTNGVKAYYDGFKLIESGLVDAVIIATPHYDHTPLTIAAFECGLHVLCEKPIAVHKEDAEKMIAAHKKHRKLKFGIMFQMRTDPAYRKIKHLISSGELGEIKRINWIVTNWFRSQRYYDSGGWRATWRGEGGGVLLNQCPHNLDLFQWLFGMPVKMRASCGLGRYHNIEVEDDVTAFCEYKNGSTGIFIASTGEAPGTNRLEITCDRGRLVVENGKIIFNRTEIPVGEFCMTTDKGFELPPVWNSEIPYPADPAGHQKVTENFVDAVLGGAVPLFAEGEEGIKSLELANSMLLSSIKQKTVDIPLDSKEYAAMLKDLIRRSKFMKDSKGGVSADLSNSFGKK